MQSILGPPQTKPAWFHPLYSVTAILISEPFLVRINWVKQRGLCEDSTTHQKRWTLQQQGDQSKCVWMTILPVQ